MELNTTNPYCFIYRTDELLIELLGGIRIDTLDGDESNNKNYSGKQEA